MLEKSHKTSPLVSVITVTFNAADNLERTLRSVLSQRYEPMEVIVVDGKSTDGTVNIIHRYERNITKWVSEPDGGIYDAMNKGVRMASGEWVIFMNAGDTFAADDVLQRIFVEPECGIKDDSRCRSLDNADIIYGDVVKDGSVKKAPASYRLYHRMLFCHQSSLARRTLLLTCPFDTSHRLSADLKFFLTQYLRHARFLYVGFPIANFDTTGVSNTRRSEGLRDNMRVVSEVVPFQKKIMCLLRLMVPYIMCKLRGK